ncbi:cardiotrophin-1-like [Rhineura floridana]|uniref:cardiotrophin-1-like n=1 Tax=Rhineura floridana TaxID=261503 RepID=UPI002AC86BC0|nr:cardiotrophin-1-like [Rhineura floridana]
MIHKSLPSFGGKGGGLNSFFPGTEAAGMCDLSLLESKGHLRSRDRRRQDRGMGGGKSDSLYKNRATKVHARSGGNPKTERRGRMEVLSVDLSNLLSSSSSRSQQEIAFKIKKAHNQTVHMQDHSEQLLRDYVFLQGAPFGSADFNPSIQPFPGLPLPSLSAKAWLDLSDAERLQQNNTAFSNLPEFLAAVKRQQDELNPTADDLHHQLKTSGLECLGLSNNLNSIMVSMGIVPGPAMPAEPPGLESAFFMKLTGYRVCHLYRDWVNRCHKDLTLLATKYPA